MTCQRRSQPEGMDDSACPLDIAPFFGPKPGLPDPAQSRTLGETSQTATMRECDPARRLDCARARTRLCGSTVIGHSDPIADTNRARPPLTRLRTASERRSSTAISGYERSSTIDVGVADECRRACLLSRGGMGTMGSSWDTLGLLTPRRLGASSWNAAASSRSSRSAGGRCGVVRAGASCS